MTPIRECPAGWVSAAGGSACDAILPTSPCPAGTKPVIGQTTCQAALPVGCAAGFEVDPSGWGCRDITPEALCEGATREAVGSTTCQPVGDCDAAFPPAEATLFVDASFTAGQLDASHFQGISAAVAAAPAGAVVAIEGGTYSEQLSLARGVTLVGRCAAQVQLVAPLGSGSPGIVVTAGKSELRGITVKGHFNGTIVRPGAEISVTEVVYDSNRILGLRVEGKATVRRSVFRDGVSDAGRWGLGVLVRAGGQATLQATSISRNTQSGIEVEEPGSTATLEEVVVRATRARADLSPAMAVEVQEGGAVVIRRSVIAGNEDLGVYVGNPAGEVSRADIVDSVIRDTRGREVGRPIPSTPEFLEFFGTNLWVVGNAKATVSRSALLRSAGDSLIVAIAPAEVEVVDSLVRKSTPLPNGYRTRGVSVQKGGLLRMSGSAVVGILGQGVTVLGDGSRAEITDSVVADTDEVPPSQLGHGLVVHSGAQVELRRSAVVGSQGSALRLGRAVVYEGPGTALVEGSVLAHGRPSSGGLSGRGIGVWDQSQLLLRGSAVLGTQEVGLIVGGAGSTAVVTGSVVRDSLPDASGLLGRGINVQDGAAIQLDETLVSGNYDVALVVTTGSSGRMVGGAVSGTLPRLADGNFGDGILCDQGARLELSGVRLSNHSRIALLVSEAAASLERGVLSSNPVALHAQGGVVLREMDQPPPPPGPLELLVTQDTRFEGNGVRIGSGTVPLPDPFTQ